MLAAGDATICYPTLNNSSPQSYSFENSLWIQLGVTFDWMSSWMPAAKGFVPTIFVNFPWVLQGNIQTDCSNKASIVTLPFGYWPLYS